MDGIKFSGIVLKSIDYKDNDKLLSLYTLEKGKIVASIRGVKKAGARLAYASEPFCFGQFMLSNRAERYLVTGCDMAESFFDLRCNLDKFYTGCAILEIVDNIGLPGEGNNQLFVLTLRALKNLCYGDADSYNVLIYFIANCIKNSGYKLALSACASCNGGDGQRVFFDFSMGGVVCAACKKYQSVNISPAALNSLRIISACGAEALSNVKINLSILKECTGLLTDYLEFLFNKKLKSTAFLS
jgi:DNA repair protein RecO (recombination protein O)